VTPWRHRNWLVVIAACLLSACKAPPELRPDQVLRDSLDLTDRDRVHTLRLSAAASGAETVLPEWLEVAPGDYVSIETVDRRARSVGFERDSLPPEAAEWAESAGLFASPLLPDSGARWVLDCSDAPLGAYPFRVLGGGADGHGVIRVDQR